MLRLELDFFFYQETKNSFNLHLFQLSECQVNKAILIFKESMFTERKKKKKKKNTLPPSANCTVDLSTCTVPNQI